MMRIEHERGPVELRDALPGDEAALLGLFEECAEWFEAATGLPPGPGDVQSLCYALPEGAAAEAKRLWVVEAVRGGGGLLGVVDAVVGHPGPGGVAVGLFLLAPRARRVGLGSAVAGALLERARERGVCRVTATVPEGWVPGARFLAAVGFEVAGGAVKSVAGNRRVGPREGAVRRAVWTA
ncbi:GNAT family N-acetyltransferase [Streptomyces sp. NPDC050560]|uniref:GNAT family N-acetyltransferase n=1 Tax=Streptomyces sp. NPDC050560 TaxID=3365630 RepID=UPI00379D90A0